MYYSLVKNSRCANIICVPTWVSRAETHFFSTAE